MDLERKEKKRKDTGILPTLVLGMKTLITSGEEFGNVYQKYVCTFNPNSLDKNMQ